jgi:hypothetical protein
VAEKKKSALQKRLEQNKGVKAGTVRMGAKGKGLRKFNEKTGRWEKFGYGSRTGAKSTKAPTSLRPPTGKTDTPKAAPVSKPTAKAKAAAMNKSAGRASMAAAAAKQGRANTKAARATPAEKTYKAASEAVGRFMNRSQQDWISRADREKRARQAKVEADALKRSRERLKELQKRGKK